MDEYPTTMIQTHESCLCCMLTEILSLIFDFTALPRGPTTQTAPWTVSAVCARWRTIAISQPHFWTFIDLRSPLRTSMSLTRLKIQLARSGELPLDVQFSMLSPELKAIDSELLEALCAASGRWGTLSLEGTDELYTEIGELMEYPLALLREVKVRMFERRDDGPLDIFHDAPLLQTVVANKSQDVWRVPLPMTLPYAQLLRYGGSNTWDGHLDLLCNASNLVDCTLEIQRLGRTALPRIHLPNLQRLSLSQPAFLEGLETPALLELYCGFASPSPLLPFLRRQSCRLRKLVLWERWDWTAPDSDASELTHIIDAVPTLTELGLLIPLPAAFAWDLNARPDMAPALECISTFSGMGRAEDDDESYEQHLLQALEWRWAGGRLKRARVYMYERPEFSAGILNRIERLRAQGMEFMVSGYSLFDDLVPVEFQIESFHGDV
ncbi:hypothetical protein C8R46DRAFT_593926 [Mycena filopes]|nr:hypothetical protein C8R46DRAFT_593926 [Mycena filopes]